MADVCGLAGHVGSGDDEELVFGVGCVDVVGNESSVSEDVFDYGVSSVVDFEEVAVVEERHRPVVFGGDAGEGEADVNVGDRCGCSHDCGGVFGDLLTDASVDGLFEFADLVGGSEDLVFEVFEFGGYESFGVDEGLAALEFGRDFFEVGAGDFDVVAEDSVVPYF